MPSLAERFKNSWNAFFNNKDPSKYDYNVGAASSVRPDRSRFFPSNERTIVMAIYNRIAMDVAAIDIKHVRLDKNQRFIAEIDSGLNSILNLEANVDQTGRSFIQDAVISLFDEGSVALVPTDASENPNYSASYDIYAMRTAKILEWYPEYVRVRVYNERLGRQEDILVRKSSTAIIQNPFYDIMNAPNSTIRRLTRKLNMLDAIDEQANSGKLDLIIQLPYAVKTAARRQQAEQRRKDIELQLTGSKYGIAYTDATERITQLNRSIENNLMEQVKYLTDLAFSQLGITQEILNGTANEETMTNYYNRVVEPVLSSITDELKRKYLTKTARTQGQSIEFFRDPFKLVAVTKLADIADRFTRNEILTSNEIRQIVGMKPSDDPNADQLRNKNMPTQMQPEQSDQPAVEDEASYIQNSLNELDEFDKQLDDLEEQVK